MYRDVWKKILAVVMTMCLAVAMVQLPSGILKAENAKAYHIYQYGESESAGIAEAQTAAAVFMTGQNENGEAEIFESVSFDVYIDEAADRTAKALVELYTSPNPGEPASGTYAALDTIDGLVEGTNRISLEGFSVKLMKGECFTVVVTLEGEGVSFYTDEFDGNQRTFVKAADGRWQDLGETGRCAVIRAVTSDAETETAGGFFRKTSKKSKEEKKDYMDYWESGVQIVSSGEIVDYYAPDRGRIDDIIRVITNIADATIVFTNGTNYGYTGASIRPEIEVWAGDTRLTANTDYSVSYDNNIEVGTGSVTVTGMGAYNGQQTANFEILPTSVSLDNVTVTPIDDQEFTGSPIYPTVTATYRNINNVPITLVQDVDYTITYENNVNVGTAAAAVATIHGRGLFSGSKSLNFRIVAHPIQSDDVKVAEIEEQAYTGNMVTPELTLTYGDYTLQLNRDYTVIYSDNVEKGTATAVIEGQNNFSGSRLVQFQIVSDSMLDAEVIGVEDSYPYTGKAIRPTGFIVKIDDKILTEWEDYMVTYGPNTELGTGTIYIEGTGFYKSNPKEVTFRISKKDISDDDIEMEGFIDSFIYNGEAIEQNITLRYGSFVLQQGLDYSIQYFRNNSYGTATMTVTGLGNYTGSFQKEYALYKTSAIDSEVTIENMSSVYVYTGEPIMPEPKLSRNGVELVAGEDYDLVFENNVNAGIAVMRIEGRDNCPGVREEQFTIIKRSIHLANVSGIGTQTYTGWDIEPKVSVTDNGGALTADKDYVVNYRLNREPGTGIAVINGIGNYTGATEVRFDIRPGGVAAIKVMETTESTVTISWSSGGASTGYEIFRAGADGEYYRIARKVGTTYMDTQLTGGQIYYYKVRAYYVAEGDTYYGTFSPSVRATAAN